MSTNPHQSHFARLALRRLVALVTGVALIAAPLAGAQAPAAAGNAAQAPSPEELEKLVAPFALYPDDLVALILPASTNPLQMVQAERFLEKRKKDPKLPIDSQWDDAVKSLVNYPEIVKRMSDDLDWTADLGEAVVANQGAVLDAVQSFRRKAQSAGNLKSDPKQSVVVEQEVIKIVPADPQVIYVPQYNPTTVVAYSPYPAYGYYPYAYPSYYYPYAPGAALATGLIWGAALGAVWSGNRYGASWSGGNNNITVNRNTNVNANRSQTRSQSTAWKSDKRPGQVSSGAGRAGTSSRFASNRPGDAAGGARGDEQRGGDRAGGTQRGGDRAGGEQRGGDLGSRGSSQRGAEGAGGDRGAQRGAEGARGSTQRGAESAGGARSSQLGGDAGGARGGSAQRSGAQGGGALGGYGSGNAARANSSRGAASRSSMSGGSMRGGGGRRGR